MVFEDTKTSFGVFAEAEEVVGGRGEGGGELDELGLEDAGSGVGGGEERSGEADDGEWG